jgi:hypothetical protein
VTLPVDEARQFCEDISAAGVRATIDPRKIVPPCLLLVPPTVTLDRLEGVSGQAEWQGFLLASVGSGNTDAWTQLDQLAAKVLPLLPVEIIQPSDYSPDGTTEYPAYTLTWTSQVEYSAP